MHQAINLPLLNFIGSKSWAISMPGIHSLAGHAKSDISLEFEDFFELRPESVLTENGTAIIHVHSALVDSCPPIYEKLGLVTSYDTISEDIEEAQNNSAERICFVFDTPGGTVSGLEEMGTEIAGLSIPTMAFCKFACSAGYYLAAACDTIIASPSSMVGNIGTILSWADTDKFWNDMGVVFKAITNEGADLKSTFHLEPDASQLEFLQNWITDTGNAFRAHVELYRPWIDAEVFRAGWYSGDKAGMLGLIDGMSTLENAILEFEK